MRAIEVHSRRRVRGSAADLTILGFCGMLAACAGRSDQSIQEARDAVENARTNQEVVAHAPNKLADAEAALGQTEAAYKAGDSQVEVDHLAYIAEQQAAIARATADERNALREIDQLGEQRDQLALNSRDRQIRSLQTQLADLQAQTTDRGLVVTLGDVLFDVDRAELAPGGELKVAHVAEALRQKPDRKILIEGHTDSSGSASYNSDLSQRRANAVEALLINQGVDPTRIVARGYGESYPVATNDTAAGRQQNRRVEIVILKPGASEAPRTSS
jgi:OOP family OmpA-OmpF porin